MSESAGESTPSSPLGASPKRIFSTGTLRYTTFGLAVAFIWLLWGDFIWTLLDGNLPNILPLKLKDMGASDTMMVFVNKTIAYGIIFFLAPLVSFSSDRYRSRWGRRIPFLFWSTPFVGLFLVLIGCYDDLTQFAIGDRQDLAILGWHFSRAAVTLGVFAAILVGFDFANIFVNTIYWYLFNDVVPRQYLSRFLSLFRMTGILAGMAYNYWIMPISLSHFKIVFVVGGIVYVVGFMLMCIFLREGRYPPPPENVDRKTGLISSIKTFAKECFTHRFYWYFFLVSTFFFVSWQAGQVFQILRNRDSLHLTLAQLGMLGVYTAPVSFALQYPAGWLADKYNPIRVYFWITFVCFLSGACQLVWAFTDFGTAGNLTAMYVVSFIFMPFGALQGAAEIPMYMRLLPRERYGQYCAAMVMVRYGAMIFGSFLSGLFMQYLADMPKSDYYVGTGGITVSSACKEAVAWHEEEVGPWKVVYGNDRSENGTITVPGATAVKVCFSEVKTEPGFDHLTTDADIYDDWSGEFLEASSGRKTGDTVRLALTSGLYVTSGGKLVVRNASNASSTGFIVAKVAWQGAKTGPVTRSGALWETSKAKFQLSGRVTRKVGKDDVGLPGVVVSFAGAKPGVVVPAPVLSDAHGNWACDGFDNGLAVKVSLARADIGGRWTLPAPEGEFTRDAADIKTSAAWTPDPNAKWTVEDVGDLPEHGAFRTWAGKYFFWLGMGLSKDLVPWTVEYANRWDRTGTITVPGAAAVKVIFGTLKTEPGWDHLIADGSPAIDWSGSFDGDNNSAASGDTMTLRLTSGIYAKSGGSPVVRLPSNMFDVKFTIVKVAYLGKRTGPITRSGSLWDVNPKNFELSGNVGGGTPTVGAKVSFIPLKSGDAAPPAVLTDARGNWVQSGFVELTHYRIEVSKSEPGEKWDFGKTTMGDWRYRWYPVWAVFFQVFALFFLVLLYREWKKLGGAESYVPPAA